MTSLSLSEVWASGRATKKTIPRTRPAFLLRLVATIATLLPTWRKVRSASLQISAFAVMDYGIWNWSHNVGWIAIGVSILVLEAFGDTK